MGGMRARRNVCRSALDCNQAYRLHVLQVHTIAMFYDGIMTKKATEEMIKKRRRRDDLGAVFFTGFD
jgi:hypothetical protein